ncbi:hypothetical protein GN956_G27356, partial [Arapaima gigas]
DFNCSNHYNLNPFTNSNNDLLPMVVVPFFKPSNFCSTRYFPPLDHHYNPIHNHSPSTMVEVESDFNCSNHYNL